VLSKHDFAASHERDQLKRRLRKPAFWGVEFWQASRCVGVLAAQILSAYGILLAARIVPWTMCHLRNQIRVESHTQFETASV